MSEKEESEPVQISTEVGDGETSQMTASPELLEISTERGDNEEIEPSAPERLNYLHPSKFTYNYSRLSTQTDKI